MPKMRALKFWTPSLPKQFADSILVYRLPLVIPYININYACDPKSRIKCEASFLIYLLVSYKK
jgi:hypothetical protein